MTDVAELGVGEVAEVTCRDEDLLLYRTPNGKLHAVTAYCPHLKNYMPNGLPTGSALSELLHDNELQCPFHGWRFNEAGQCSHVPPGQRVPPAVRAGRPVLRRWAVRETQGSIEIGQLLP